MTSQFILTEGQPVLFDFFSNLKKKDGVVAQTFLFLGNSHHEILITQMMQMMNCPNFLEKNHQTLSCPVCFGTNALQKFQNVYSIFTQSNIKHLSTLLSLYQPGASSLLKESLIHELYKLEPMLQQQTHHSNSKSIPLKKLEEIINMVHSTISCIKNDLPYDLNSWNEALKNTILNMNYHIYIEHLESIHSQLLVNNHSLSYQFLLIKNPSDLPVLAQNHLLKLIEEPPKGTIIIFMAENTRSILQTILSRCIKIKFKPYNKEILPKIASSFPDFPQDHFNIHSFESLDLSNLPPYDDNLSFNTILAYYEKLDSTLTDLSPISAKKRVMLKQMIVGGKYFSMNKKHLYDVLSTLIERSLK